MAVTQLTRKAGSRVGGVSCLVIDYSSVFKIHFALLTFGLDPTPIDLNHQFYNFRSGENLFNV